MLSRRRYWKGCPSDCCFFSSLKTLLMQRRSLRSPPARRQRPGALRVVAGFQVPINRRFWVSTEG